MAAKKGKKKEEASFLGGLPLGSAFQVAEGLGGMALKLVEQRYQVGKKVEEFKQDSAEKVEEFKEEAVRTGYEVKKAIIRTIFEAILFATGLFALIIGALHWLKRNLGIELDEMLLAYGLLVTAYIVFTMKTSPDA